MLGGHRHVSRTPARRQRSKSCDTLAVGPCFRAFVFRRWRPCPLDSNTRVSFTSRFWRRSWRYSPPVPPMPASSENRGTGRRPRRWSRPLPRGESHNGRRVTRGGTGHESSTPKATPARIMTYKPEPNCAKHVTSEKPPATKRTGTDFVERFDVIAWTYPNDPDYNSLLELTSDCHQPQGSG